MIEGVTVTNLKIIKDDRGSVMHMLRCDSPIFTKFGEIYFSTVNLNSIKAWHLHKESTLNYACIAGKIKLVLYDNREKSKTKGSYYEFTLSPDNHRLVTIPKNIWNGFKGIEGQISIVANCMTLPHNEREMVRKDPFDKNFEYNW